MEVRQRSLMAGILMAALVVAPMAEAKRAGGGKSHGMSRSAAPSQSYQQPRQATPAPQPTTAPTQQKSGSGVGKMVAAGVAGFIMGFQSPTDQLVGSFCCIYAACYYVLEPAAGGFDADREGFTALLKRKTLFGRVFISLLALLVYRAAAKQGTVVAHYFCAGFVAILAGATTKS